MDITSIIADVRAAEITTTVSEAAIQTDDGDGDDRMAWVVFPFTVSYYVGALCFFKIV